MRCGSASQKTKPDSSLRQLCAFQTTLRLCAFTKNSHQLGGYLSVERRWVGFKYQLDLLNESLRRKFRSLARRHRYILATLKFGCWPESAAHPN